MNHPLKKNSFHNHCKVVIGVFKLSMLAFASSLTCVSMSFAQQMAFPSAPPGTGGVEPAPNVIVSVDDSGSMGWDANGCRTAEVNNLLYVSNADNNYAGFHLTGSVNCPAPPTLSVQPSRMAALKAALKTQFGDGASNSGQVADGRIRLAWQSMWNNGNSPGAGTLAAGAVNAIKPFENSANGTPGGAQHRTNFNTFVNGLIPANGTPSHAVVSNVDAYMRQTGQDSPWKNRPGAANSPELSCRRAYHVFMTDGSWNTEDGKTNAAPFLAQPASIGNIDGNVQPLPTPDSSVTDSFTQAVPTQYTPFSAATRIYGDAWAMSNGTTQTGSYGYLDRRNNVLLPMTQPRNLGTLSDFAFKSWVQDLQDGIPNAVRPTMKAPGNQTVGTGTTATVLPEFWNPRNNPATWQHVVTHTIGFGNTASSWVGAPAWDTTTDNPYTGDYANLVNGTAAWGNPMIANVQCANQNNLLGCIGNDYRSSELWHMALNGRGKFYPARTPQALNAAFNDILSNVLADTSKPSTSIAANTRTLQSGTNVYLAGYSGKKWSGSLSARSIDKNTGIIQSGDVWNAATLLDARDFNDRFILSYGTKFPATTPSGISWSALANLPLAQSLPLARNSAGSLDIANTLKRFDFIRGDRTNEETATPAGIFRSRESKLGDIVNSNVWYTGAPNSGFTLNSYSTFKTSNASREPMLYIGANDGMLHGFSATTGIEKLAYIPQGIAQGALRNLTDANYVHRFYVDGHPFTGDYYNGSSWQTALVGTLGAGGKGYFILDATNPANYTETQAPNLVITDTTASTDPDMGHIFSKPVVDDVNSQLTTRQIVRLNNNRWAMVTGNGYNSTNEAPVLIIQYLDGDKSIKKLSPCIPAPVAPAICAFAGSNGLSAPQLINLNGDGTADVAYAGDLKGNLWKFNLSSSSDSNWGVSFGNRPFFIARTVGTPTVPSVRQAITTAPYWTTNKAKGGVMILVATGRNLTKPDQTSTGVDSLYALHDLSSHTTTTNLTNGVKTLTIDESNTTPINLAAETDLPSTLVKQSFYQTGTVDDSGYKYYRQTENDVDYNGSSASVSDAKRGWYINWPKAGQRVLTDIENLAGDVIFVQGVIPASEVATTEETCTPQTSNEKGFVAVFNANYGTPPSTPAFNAGETANANVDFSNITLRDSDRPGESVLIRDLDRVLTPKPCPAGQACGPGGGGLSYGGAINTGLYGTIGVRANWRETQQ